MKKMYAMEGDPLWFKDAVIYEVPVRAFYDANGDGVGDFRGLKEKLGYIEDLGISALWLLPFYPSPLKDDGYDISDYFSIHHDYGTLADFRDFLAEAHRRGIRVITELVLNHTSDQHAWFQRSRTAKRGTVWKDFYLRRCSGQIRRYPDYLQGFRDIELGMGPGSPLLLLPQVLFPSTGPSTTTAPTCGT